METMRVANVEEAIQLATKLKQDGTYDWFRGQLRGWMPSSSLARKTAADPQAMEHYTQKLMAILDWLRATPQLAHLGEPANADMLFAILQHYGFPTCYIDFTTDPAVAGFFSADGTAPPGDDGDSVIYCLDSADLLDFYAGLAEIPQTEHLRAELVTVDVSNLWRLQAQHGHFLFTNHDWERVYGCPDRIVFPWTGYPSYPPKEQIYPEHKSSLEQLLDQYFFADRARDGYHRLLGQLDALKRAGKPPHVAWTTAHAGGYVASEFSGALDALPGWAPECLAGWRALRDEAFAATVGRSIKIALRAGANAPGVEVQVRVAVLAALNREAGLRGQALEWDFRGATGSLADAAFAAAFRDAWNGMRTLPFSDEDIAASLGCLAALWADADFQRRDMQVIEAAFRRRWPDARELEFSTLDDAFSKGWCSDADLAAAIDPAWAGKRVDESAPVTVWQALLLTQHPRLLFDFGRFASVFCRQVIPSQLVIRRSLVLFNPAELARLGLP